MPIITLVLQERRAHPPRKREPAILTSTALSHAYLPRRGIPLSLVLHAIAFAPLTYIPILPLPEPPLRKRPAEQVVMIELKDPMAVMFLPDLFEGGRGGENGPAKSANPGGAPPAPRPSRAPRGFSYPGPQEILSKLPQPTNRIQTILQPGLQNPQILKPPIALPNLVQMAGVVSVPPPPEPERPPETPQPPEEPVPEPPAATQPNEPMTEPVLPIEPAPPPSIEPPAITLPVAVVPPPEPPKPHPPEVEPTKPEPVREETPKTAPPKKEIPKPEPPKPEPPRPAPKPKVQPVEPKPLPKPDPAKPEQPKQAEAPKVDLAPLPGRTNDIRDLLALTPIPAAPGKEIRVPAGEARGDFAISPQPNLSAKETSPGFNIEGPPEPAPANKTALPVQRGEPGKGQAAASIGRAGAAAARAKEATAGGLTGGGRGTAAGSGTGAAVASGGSGITVIGSGGGAGTGTGSGTGAGNSPFSGITVIAGGTDSGFVSNPGASPAMPPRPLQTAYGLSIISTENSGGGLPSYGVFSNEQIYTVYLDMRKTEYDPQQDWTLEFAVVQGATPAASGSTRSQEGLVLPFPAVKDPPQFPAEIVRRNLRRMIVVYAVIDTEGKMEQISIKETPDPALNEPLISSLARWVFRPAHLNGQAVAAKVLIGILLQ